MASSSQSGSKRSPAAAWEAEFPSGLPSRLRSPVGLSRRKT